MDLEESLGGWHVDLKKKKVKQKEHDKNALQIKGHIAFKKPAHSN